MSLRRFKTIALLLCAACFALTGWMVFHSLTGARLVGCDAGSGCDSVTGSPWAYVARGIPVSLPAAVVYLLLALSVLFLGGESPEDRSLDRFLWPLMLFLSGCIVGVAIWFFYLQAFVLHAFCKYCILTHLLGVIVAVWIIVAAPRKYGWFIVGLLAAAAFAVVQVHTKPDVIYDAGKADLSLPSFTDEEIPALGSAEAPKELTLLFDFQCIHCRRLHQVLPEVVAGGEYRIRLCPVPLSSACNPYIPNTGIDRFAGSCPLTRYALAVWYARPDAYEAYWDYLLGNGDEHAVMDPAAAESCARELLGDGCDAAFADPRIDNYLKKVEELFGRTSNAERSGVPRLIRDQNWLVPETDQADKLLELIRLSL